MRHKRWLELIKDYDLTINYTPGKANVVANALSRKSADIQPSNRELPKELQMDLETLELQFIRIEVLRGLATMQVVAEQDSDLKQEIFRHQAEDPFIAEEIRRTSQGQTSVFHLGDYESLWFQDRLCVPDVTEIRDVILREAHETPYSIHPGSTKMYMDLK